MTTPAIGDVPTEVIDAALRAAQTLGRDVADVPLVAIAREAGMSRSTLIRRVHGSRQLLDDAVRATGVEPGGRPPVRERAVEAAAALISERGLAAITLEAVAAQADCSVHSLYAVFGGRDELLRRVFDRYGPILDLEDLVAEPNAELSETVRRIYRVLTTTFSREPRVAPAMLAEGLARPTGPTAQAVLQYFVPRMLAGVGQWLTREIDAGRIRDLPLPLLIQQMLAPIVIHTLARPAAARIPEVNMPPLDVACTVFADNFLRAVAL